MWNNSLSSQQTVDTETVIENVTTGRLERGGISWASIVREACSSREVKDSPKGTCIFHQHQYLNILYYGCHGLLPTVHLKQCGRLHGDLITGWGISPVTQGSSVAIFQLWLKEKFPSSNLHGLDSKKETRVTYVFRVVTMISRGYLIKCWLFNLFLLKVEEPFHLRHWKVIEDGGGRERGKDTVMGNAYRITTKVYESQHTRDR